MRIPREIKEALLRQANVVAVGIGYKTVANKKTDELAVVCSVKKKVPSASLSKEDWIRPYTSTEDGDMIRTDVIETGEIVALSRIERHRPAPGGVSIGHVDITAGTLGCLVNYKGMPHILSNWHVLCAGGQVGDKILQPGPYDGGADPDDLIALLAKFVPIEFVGEPDPEPDCPISRMLNFAARHIRSRYRVTKCRTDVGQMSDTYNRVDAALAQPITPNLVTSDILEVGVPNGMTEGQLGMTIKKSGRTTGLTTGEITQVDATVIVSYGGDKRAMFEDQLMAGEMCAGGDSGSLVLDDENRMVGLLFAGSTSTTVINRIQNVCDELELD